MGWEFGQDGGEECILNFGREASWKMPTWKTEKETEV